MFFSAPKMMIVLAVVFFLLFVPGMAGLTILVRRKKEPDKDG